MPSWLGFTDVYKEGMLQRDCDDYDVDAVAIAAHENGTRSLTRL